MFIRMSVSFESREMNILLSERAFQFIVPSLVLVAFSFHSFRLNVPLTPPQSRVFAELFKWRDAMARREDESPRFVLPICLMLLLATSRTSSDFHS